MKIKLLLSLLLVVLGYSTSYASFPVKRTVKQITTAELNTNSSEEVYTPLAAVADKDLTVGIVLWFFLGLWTLSLNHSLLQWVLLQKH